MVWVRIDDHFDEHPKIAALSDSAVAVFVAGLAYCNRNLTDGFIPHMIGTGKLRFCAGNPSPILKELESAGIFEPVSGGWHIHDYLDYQPSKQRVLEERAASARRMQGTRKRRKVAGIVAPQLAGMLQTSCTFPVPVPVPVPTPVPKTKTKPPPTSRALPEAVEWGASCCLILKYNKEAPDNVPSVRSLSDARLERERRFLRMFPEEQWWTVTFRQYHRSRFLSGHTEPNNGHKAFQPDFDWLLSKGKDGIENCVKVHDGRYQAG